MWKRNRKILSQCEDAQFLVEGVWSADPESRKRELEARAKDWHVVVERSRKRSERRAQCVEDVVRVIAEALTPIAERMTSDDSDIKICIAGDLEITVNAKGVCREAVPAIPF